MWIWKLNQNSHTHSSVPPGYVSCKCHVCSTCRVAHCLHQMLPSWLTKPLNIVVSHQPLFHHHWQAPNRITMVPGFSHFQNVRSQPQSNTNAHPICSSSNELTLYIKEIIVESWSEEGGRKMLTQLITELHNECVNWWQTRLHVCRQERYLC